MLSLHIQPRSNNRKENTCKQLDSKVGKSHSHAHQIRKRSHFGTKRKEVLHQKRLVTYKPSMICLQIDGEQRARRPLCCACKHAQICIDMHAQSTHTQTHSHACTHTCMHACTHTHTHTLSACVLTLIVDRGRAARKA